MFVVTFAGKGFISMSPLINSYRNLIHKLIIFVFILYRKLFLQYHMLRAHNIGDEAIRQKLYPNGAPDGPVRTGGPGRPKGSRCPPDVRNERKQMVREQWKVRCDLCPDRGFRR